MVVGFNIIVDKTVVGKKHLDFGLVSDQWKNIGKALGLSYVSKMSVNHVRIRLAEEAQKCKEINRVVLGDIFETSASHNVQKTRNTQIRMLNVIFSEGYREQLLTWNDPRNREAHETGVGGKMQRFLKEVKKEMLAGGDAADDGDSGGDRLDISSSDDDSIDALLSDNARVREAGKAKDPYGDLDDFSGWPEESDREEIQAYMDSVEEDPSDYLANVSYLQLDVWIKLLIKARAKINTLISVSGNGEYMFHRFTRKALEQSKMTKKLGEFVLFYFCMKAHLTPDFDNRFSPFLNDNLKGDSTDDLSELSSAGAGKGSKTGSFFDDRDGDSMVSSIEKLVAVISDDQEQNTLVQHELLKSQGRESKMRQLGLMRDIMNGTTNPDELERITQSYQQLMHELFG
jgi:hypothetical protein